MSIYTILADYNGYGTWDDMLASAKEHAIEFKIPQYLNKVGDSMVNNEVFQNIKDNGLKLTVEGGIIMLINDVQTTET